LIIRHHRVYENLTYSKQVLHKSHENKFFAKNRFHTG